MRLSGAEILARVLIEQGVDTIFGYPGAAVLPIYDALFDHRDRITHYITAHEQGASHAADGYARSTGRAGVVLVTSGPGSTNVVTGVAAAFMDSSPLIVITGNVATPFIGKDSFQEVYTTGITLPITKHNFYVQDVSLLASTLREAFTIATSGRKGPVLIDITKDAQAAWCEFEPEQKLEPAQLVQSSQSAQLVQSAQQSAGFTQVDIDTVLERLTASAKPLIIVGGGIISANASPELRSFIQATRMPAVHSIMGIGALDVDDPYNLGLVGMHGRQSGNRALGEADLILALGFRFSDRVALNTEKWAARAHIIQVDIDPSEVDKNVKVDHAIIGDVRDVLLAFQEALQKRGRLYTDNSCWLDKINSWLGQIHSWRADDSEPQDDDTQLKPHQIMRTIAAKTSGTAIITTDVGQHQMWAAQYCGQMQPRSFITSGGLGAMGFGYGAALGAQVGAALGAQVGTALGAQVGTALGAQVGAALGAQVGTALGAQVGAQASTQIDSQTGATGNTKRNRPVIHITGDGSFHMNLNEACTVVSYQLPVITIILNNQVLGMVRQWQKVFYDERYCVSTLNRTTDYVKLAEGFGLAGMRATTIAEFEDALTQALQIDGPCWIECVINSDEQVSPMIPSGGTVEETIVL